MASKDDVCAAVPRPAAAVASSTDAIQCCPGFSGYTAQPGWQVTLCHMLHICYTHWQCATTHRPSTKFVSNLQAAANTPAAEYAAGHAAEAWPARPTTQAASSMVGYAAVDWAGRVCHTALGMLLWRHQDRAGASGGPYSPVPPRDADVHWCARAATHLHTPSTALQAGVLARLQSSASEFGLSGRPAHAACPAPAPAPGRTGRAVSFVASAAGAPATRAHIQAAAWAFSEQLCSSAGLEAEFPGVVAEPVLLAAAKRLAAGLVHACICCAVDSAMAAAHIIATERSFVGDAVGVPALVDALLLGTLALEISGTDITTGTPSTTRAPGVAGGPAPGQKIQHVPSVLAVRGLRESFAHGSPVPAEHASASAVPAVNAHATARVSAALLCPCDVGLTLLLALPAGGWMEVLSRRMAARAQFSQLIKHTASASTLYAELQQVVRVHAPLGLAPKLASWLAAHPQGGLVWARLSAACLWQAHALLLPSHSSDAAALASTAQLERASGASRPSVDPPARPRRTAVPTDIAPILRGWGALGTELQHHVLQPVAPLQHPLPWLLQDAALTRAVQKVGTASPPQPGLGGDKPVRAPLLPGAVSPPMVPGAALKREARPPPSAVASPSKPSAPPAASGVAKPKAPLRSVRAPAVPPSPHMSTGIAKLPGGASVSPAAPEQPIQAWLDEQSTALPPAKLTAHAKQLAANITAAMQPAGFSALGSAAAAVRSQAPASGAAAAQASQPAGTANASAAWNVHAKQYIDEAMQPHPASSSLDTACALGYWPVMAAMMGEQLVQIPTVEHAHAMICAPPAVPSSVLDLVASVASSDDGESVCSTGAGEVGSMLTERVLQACLVSERCRRERLALGAKAEPDSSNAAQSLRTVAGLDKPAHQPSSLLLPLLGGAQWSSLHRVSQALLPGLDLALCSLCSLRSLPVQAMCAAPSPQAQPALTALHRAGIALQACTLLAPAIGMVSNNAMANIQRAMAACAAQEDGWWAMGLVRAVAQWALGQPGGETLPAVATLRIALQALLCAETSPQLAVLASMQLLVHVAVQHQQGPNSAWASLDGALAAAELDCATLYKAAREAGAWLADVLIPGADYMFSRVTSVQGGPHWEGTLHGAASTAIHLPLAKLDVATRDDLLPFRLWDARPAWPALATLSGHTTELAPELKSTTTKTDSAAASAATTTATGRRARPTLHARRATADGPEPSSTARPQEPVASTAAAEDGTADGEKPAPSTTTRRAARARQTRTWASGQIKAAKAAGSMLGDLEALQKRRTARRHASIDAVPDSAEDAAEEAPAAPVRRKPHLQRLLTRTRAAKAEAAQPTQEAEPALVSASKPAEATAEAPAPSQPDEAAPVAAPAPAPAPVPVPVPAPAPAKTGLLPESVVHAIVELLQQLPKLVPSQLGLAHEAPARRSLLRYSAQSSGTPASAAPSAQSDAMQGLPSQSGRLCVNGQGSPDPAAQRALRAAHQAVADLPLRALLTLVMALAAAEGDVYVLACALIREHKASGTACTPLFEPHWQREAAPLAEVASALVHDGPDCVTLRRRQRAAAPMCWPVLLRRSLAAAMSAGPNCPKSALFPAGWLVSASALANTGASSDLFSLLPEDRCSAWLSWLARATSAKPNEVHQLPELYALCASLPAPLATVPWYACATGLQAGAPALAQGFLGRSRREQLAAALAAFGQHPDGIAAAQLWANAGAGPAVRHAAAVSQVLGLANFMALAGLDHTGTPQITALCNLLCEAGVLPRPGRSRPQLPRVAATALSAQQLARQLLWQGRASAGALVQALYKHEPGAAPAVPAAHASSLPAELRESSGVWQQCLQASPGLAAAVQQELQHVSPPPRHAVEAAALIDRVYRTLHGTDGPTSAQRKHVTAALIDTEAVPGVHSLTAHVVPGAQHCIAATQWRNGSSLYTLGCSAAAHPRSVLTNTKEHAAAMAVTVSALHSAHAAGAPAAREQLAAGLEPSAASGTSSPTHDVSWQEPSSPIHTGSAKSPVHSPAWTAAHPPPGVPKRLEHGQAGTPTRSRSSSSAVQIPERGCVHCVRMMHGTGPAPARGNLPQDAALSVAWHSDPALIRAVSDSHLRALQSAILAIPDTARLVNADELKWTHAHTAAATVSCALCQVVGLGIADAAAPHATGKLAGPGAGWSEAGLLTAAAAAGRLAASNDAAIQVSLSAEAASLLLHMQYDYTQWAQAVCGAVQDVLHTPCSAQYTQVLLDTLAAASVL